MEAEQLKLWQKIKAFELDKPDARFTFSQRLMRENGRDGKYADRVLKEYKSLS